MSDYRSLSIEGFTRPQSAPRGAVPMAQWLKLCDLVIDPAYQRDITSGGRRNIMAIAEAFDWRHFAPVIVSPVPGGKFAIVDGQHRSTAAMLLGIEEVLCTIIIADAQQQAAAFKAVNGNVSRIHPVAVYKAAVVAGDPVFCAVDRLCTAADITVCRSPTARAFMKPGQTMAPGTVADLIKTYAEERTLDALRLARALAGARGGLLIPVVLKACGMLTDGQGAAIDLMLERAARIDINRELGRAEDMGGGTPLADRLRDRLRLRFADIGQSAPALVLA